MNLKQKIRWTLLGLSVLPLLLFTWLQSASFFTESRANAQKHLTSVADFAADSLNNTLIGALRDARAIAATLSQHDHEEETMGEHLTQLAIHYPYFRELAWVRPSGVVALSTTHAHVGLPLAKVHADLAEPFARALAKPGGLQISDLDEMTAEARQRLAGGAAEVGKLNLQFLLRLDDQHGMARGVLVAEVHGAALAAVLREAAENVPGGQPALLLNQRGELLLSTGEGRLLEHHALAAAGAASDDLVVGSAALPGLPGAKAAWRVVVAAPLAVVTAQARRTLWFTAALMLGIIALGLLVSVYLARRLSGRIGVLVEGTQRMGQGEFSYRLPLQSNDELGALATAFNTMAGEIESLLSSKEQAVREQQALGTALEHRSAELQAALATMQRQNREITCATSWATCSSLAPAWTRRAR